MGSYTHERRWPELAGIRSDLRLTYDGGRLRMPARARSYPAISGKNTPQGFDFSVERQKIPFQGPIPEGVYWVAPGELWTNAWYKYTAPRSAWGDHRLSIHPFPETETHGRGGFFIHGGFVPGSAGCIDLWAHMNFFVEDLKEAVSGREDLYCILTVNYNLDFRT
jgi:hypothetical protein